MRWPGMAELRGMSRAAALIVALLAGSSLVAQQPALLPDGIPGPDQFYFGRTLIDIAGPATRVPHVDRDTVADYSDLGLWDQMYIGRVDDQARLVYLESWARQPIGEIALDTIIDGRRLGDYEVPISGNDILSQTPQFFRRAGDEWHHVPADTTRGETTFIRLRWLQPMDGGAPDKDAEIFRQVLTSISEYSYDAEGGVEKMILRQRLNDYAAEVITAP